MNISFDLEKQEVDILLKALTFAAGQTNSKESRKKILEIIQEIQLDVKLESIIGNYVEILLDPYTNASIYPSSDLRNGLGISINWINNFLFMGCNKILKKMIELYKPATSTDPISKAEAKKCKTVQDVIDLIKQKYESAS